MAGTSSQAKDVFRAQPQEQLHTQTINISITENETRADHGDAIQFSWETNKGTESLVGTVTYTDWDTSGHLHARTLSVTYGEHVKRFEQLKMELVDVDRPFCWLSAKIYGEKITFPWK